MLHRILLILLCLPTSAAHLAPAFAADKADDDFRLAAEMYRRQKWQSAADTFVQFLNDYPEHSKVPVAQLYLGLSQHNAGEYLSARGNLELYLKRFAGHSGRADAMFRLGECSFYLGDLDRAEKELQTYLDIHKTHEMRDWARLLRGDIHMARKDWKSAADHWQSMLDEDPNPRLIPDIRYGLARSLEGLDRRREGFAIFRELSESSNDQLASRSLARMGHIYFHSKDFASAARAYQAVASRFPESPDAASARMNAALALFEGSHYEAALTELTETQQDERFAVRGGLLSAKCQWKLNNVEAARSTFQQTLQKAGESASAARVMFEWAQMEQAENNSDAAIQLFVDLADRYPESEDTIESLFSSADLLLDANKPSEAARLAERLSASAADADLPVDNNIGAQISVLDGRIQLALGMPEEAVASLRSALKTDRLVENHAAVARYHLLRALHQSRQFDETIAEAAPLLERIRESNESDLALVFVIVADSFLEKRDDQAAEALAVEYLDLTTDSTGTSARMDAWRVRFKAKSLQKQFDEILGLLPDFRGEFEEDTRYPGVLLAAAESAWNQKRHSVSTRLFEQVVDLPQSVPERPQAMSGVAWSEFEGGQIEQALDATTRFINEYPDDRRVFEMQYLRGLAQAGIEQPGEAADTLESLFDTLTADREIAAGDEKKTPLKFAFEGGVLAARNYEKANQTDDANRMWEKVTTQFAMAESDAEVLFEWAGRNASRESFDQADKVHRRLLERHPTSPFADSARLALAESDWIAGRAEDARQVFTSLMKSPDSSEEIREKSMFHLITMLLDAESWQEAEPLTAEYLSRFDTNERRHTVKLFRTRALVESAKLDEADSLIREMIADASDGTIADDAWTDEIWIVAAETALAKKDYVRIDVLEQQLVDRRSDSPVMYKMNRVQGRRWKNQAPPDFEKARDALRAVTADEHGRGTEDAAKAQFLIAETFLLEDNPKDAFREYYRVHVDYQFPEMQAMALYQAGGCEQATEDYRSAHQTYTELIDTFPSAAGDLLANTLLRLSECSLKLNQVEAAKQYLQRIQNEFATTPQATEASNRLRKVTNP